MGKFFIGSLLIMGSVLFAAHNAYALTQSMNASVTFIAPLAVSAVTNPSFGKLAANVDSTVYVLDTSGTVKVSSGPGSTLGGSPAAGSMTISGSDSQTIDISSSDPASDGTVTPSNITCKYGDGDEVSCNDSTLNTADAPGAGKVLNVGLTLTTDGTEVDGDSAIPSFNITVVYN